MIDLLASLLALLQVATATPHAERVRWVPNPRVQNGGWVADPAHHLRAATVDSLNAIIAALERETSDELAVVVVDSTSGLEPADFALALHRAWGVGKHDRDNGIVFLWVPARRKVQISVGYGLEGVLPDARVGRVQDDVVLPAFRRGEFDAGLIAGVEALASAAREEGTPAQRVAPHAALGSAQSRGRTTDRTDWGLGSALGLLALLGLVGAGAFGGWRSYQRRRSRLCPNGHGPMRRLSETEDDVALDAGQRAEERVSSVDYDVWECATCGAREVVPYRRHFSGYDSCPQCGYRTLDADRETLEQPTTLHEGRERITRRCRNCAFRDVQFRRLPPVSVQASSSGSGGGGFSSGGGGGSGGGSSFGGGSAGGGGAGRSY